MPTPTPDLADLQDLIDLLPAGADQERAQSVLTAASRRFRGAVHHPVHHVAGDAVWLDGNGSTTLLLPAAPVTAVTSVEVDGEGVEDFEWSEVGVLRRRLRWPDRLRAVKVVCDHGYDPIPEEIQEVVVHQARYLYGTTPGVSMVQVGSQMVQTPGAAVSAGVTAAWTTVVEAYQLNRGDRT